MLKHIPLHLITRNPDQPRQTFEPVALQGLADSIVENGLQQPITVRPIEKDADGHTFMVIMGERRFRAHKLLEEQGKAKTILCQVKQMTDSEMHINAILENLQRADVSPLEEAVAYQRAIDVFDYTPEQLGKKLGISQIFRIHDRLRLLKLTPDSRDLLRAGILTMIQAYNMATLTPNGQRKFVELVKQGLVTTDAAAKAAVFAIDAKEAQTEWLMPEAKPRASIKSVEDRIDGVGTAIQPFFKDGKFKIEGQVDPSQAQRCAEKIKLIRVHLLQIESELMKAASASAVQ